MFPVQELERDYSDTMEGIEEKCRQKFSDKEQAYEKQMKKKEANEILMRRMDEQLKRKEAQLEVKKAELKRMHVQCSDLKNDKLRCEKKIGKFA